jgi:hypothetical protein
MGAGFDPLGEKTMNEHQERMANHAAYRQMKDTLARIYGMGQFIAISNGQVVADADSFARLHDQLKLQGQDPVQVLIVQAGVEYTETAVIFSQHQSS